jgi:fructosamine-3-kinase
MLSNLTVKLMDHGPNLRPQCKQVVDVVFPWLLGALQSEGRSIEPSLIHGDLWGQSVEVDTEIGETIVFDLGSTYAHNEIEFGTWRCSWAYYFASPVYMQLYQRHIKPSEPIKEGDDRNRLYSLHLTSITPRPPRECVKIHGSPTHVLLALNDISH